VDQNEGDEVSLPRRRGRRVTENPVIVALDLPTADVAVAMARKVAPYVGGFKVGLELMMGSGVDTVAKIGELGKPVFADAKLHDIPNTVRMAASQIGRRNPRWVTVHACGGQAMMEAAVEGLARTAPEAGVLAVTVLTSLDDVTLGTVGVNHSAVNQVGRLARLAAVAGCEGVVCSVKEIPEVKRSATSLVRFTPGVRPVGVSHNDQARVATPAEAISQGADYLVIGRPITTAPDPVEAARALKEIVMGEKV